MKKIILIMTLFLAHTALANCNLEGSFGRAGVVWVVNMDGNPVDYAGSLAAGVRSLRKYLASGVCSKPKCSMTTSFGRAGTVYAVTMDGNIVDYADSSESALKLSTYLHNQNVCRQN